MSKPSHFKHSAARSSVSAMFVKEDAEAMRGEIPHSSPVINASGHVQELERNFGLLSLCGVAVVTGSTWAALGGTITIALYNGGAPGVIYEFIAVSVVYWFIGASIAELSSSLPSAGGVYHWASVTGGQKFGKVCGFFAGWWNFLAWIFGCVSLSSVVANQLVAMYGLFHPDLEAHAWQVFVAYVIMTWICALIVMFGNRLLPTVTTIGLFSIVIGVSITIIVCAIMPSTTDEGYASNAFVWKDFENETGYTDGMAFLLGMLNGAFVVGTTDSVTHFAEEIPDPRRNIPKAILAQIIIGFLTTVFYLIALFYSINDLDSILASAINYPLAAIYRQSTGSAGGALGLMIVIFIPCVACSIGCITATSRIHFTLARDGAMPFSSKFGISSRFHNPFNSIIVCAIIVTIFGAINIGSTTAFNAFIGSYVVLSTLSYAAAIFPNLLHKRSVLPKGPFYMYGATGYIVNIIAVLLIFAFIVIYCFPYDIPFDAASMNYSSLITGGCTIFVAAWYLWKGSRGYEGPQLVEKNDALNI